MRGIAVRIRKLSNHESVSFGIQPRHQVRTRRFNRLDHLSEIGVAVEIDVDDCAAVGQRDLEVGRSVSTEADTRAVIEQSQRHTAFHSEHRHLRAVFGPHTCAVIEKRQWGEVGDPSEPGGVEDVSRGTAGQIGRFEPGDDVGADRGINSGIVSNGKRFQQDVGQRHVDVSLFDKPIEAQTTAQGVVAQASRDHVATFAANDQIRPCRPDNRVVACASVEDRAARKP